jgi:hypothetical protein
MQHRKLSQEVLTMWRQFDQNLTTVLLAMPASDGAALDKAVDEFDCAVMPQAKP